MTRWTAGTVAAMLLAGCSKTSDVPDGPPQLPSKIAVFAPKVVAQTPEVELGRALFFDERLSGDNTMSCATCHDPKKSFTDGIPRAKGNKDKLLARNTPSVTNIDSRAPYFWDGRAETAEAQALGPVTNGDEMAQDPKELVEELSVVPEYVARFADVYRAKDRDGAITVENVGKALAAYERTLVSADAPLDRFLAGNKTAMSADAQKGFTLFTGKGECVRCHDGPQLTDAGFHNIGIKGDDVGRFKIVNLPIMKGAFKTPGLRDVALTAPFFHDGSAPNLMAVIDHYDRGGDVAENRDKDIHPLHLKRDEKLALVAFLEALTGAANPAAQIMPRIPRVNAHPRDIPTRQLMKDVDGMLDNLDSLVAKLDGGHWEDATKTVEHLLDISEELAAMREKLVDPARLPELRRDVGRLIAEFVRLRQSILDHDTRRAKKAYDDVRARCEDCHTAFRSKQE